MREEIFFSKCIYISIKNSRDNFFFLKKATIVNYLSSKSIYVFLVGRYVKTLNVVIYF